MKHWILNPEGRGRVGRQGSSGLTFERSPSGLKGGTRRGERSRPEAKKRSQTPLPGPLSLLPGRHRTPSSPALARAAFIPQLTEEASLQGAVPRNSSREQDPSLAPPHPQGLRVPNMASASGNRIPQRQGTPKLGMPAGRGINEASDPWGGAGMFEPK